MSLNRVVLIGNVGKDPEIRYIDKSVCTAAFSLATSSPGYTLPNGTNVPERTEWHRILLWRRLAEIAERYIRKGDKIYVEGELRYRSYTDAKGKTHQVTEIWGNHLELLSGRALAEQSNQLTTPTTSATPTPKEELPF